jgi:glycosyltransferase involved in cell wall biosynthesis
MADAIQRVVGSQELQKQLVDRGLRRSAEFKAEDLARKVLDVYRSL